MMMMMMMHIIIFTFCLRGEMRVQYLDLRRGREGRRSGGSTYKKVYFSLPRLLSFQLVISPQNAF